MEDEKNDPLMPVLNYQPPREREGPVVPLGLSALVLVLSFMAIAAGVLVGLLPWAGLYSNKRGESPAQTIWIVSGSLIVAGLLGRWVSVRASRFRK